MAQPKQPAKKKAPAKRKAAAKKPAAKRGRGRPTAYKPEYVQGLIDYFSVDPAGEEREIVNEKTGDTKLVHVAPDFPTLAGYACIIGVCRDTLYEWSTATQSDGKTLKYPEFSYAYKRAKEFQERILVQNGLKGGYQANFAIFTAKNVLGWRDQQDHNLNATLNITIEGKDAQV